MVCAIIMKYLSLTRREYVFHCMYLIYTCTQTNGPSWKWMHRSSSRIEWGREENEPKQRNPLPVWCTHRLMPWYERSNTKKNYIYCKWTAHNMNKIHSFQSVILQSKRYSCLWCRVTCIRNTKNITTTTTAIKSLESLHKVLLVSLFRALPLTPASSVDVAA